MIVVFNPTAGRRRAAELWRVLDVLSENGVRVRVAVTAGRGDATRLAREAAEAGERLVVSAGGDGTVAEVAQGLVGHQARLGIIPIGTANVLAHELGLPFAPRDIANALAGSRSRRIWPGVATSPGGTRLFVQMVGVGFDAGVVHALPLGLKRVLGRSAYVLQGFREAVRYGFPPIRLRIDGVALETGGVIVTKGRFYAGTYLLAPGAEPGEPGFRVATFDRAGLGGTMLYGAALPAGLLPRAPGVRLVQARHVEIEGMAPVQADGDAAGHTPLSIADAAAPLDVATG